MLHNREHGYAVMNNTLTAFSIEGIDIESLKRYCNNGEVIVKRTPYVCGFSIKFLWFKWHEAISLKYSMKNILWVHWVFNKEYSHRTGAIVYRSKN